MVVNQDVAREVLARVMESGQRYTVGGLQVLFEESYDDWEDEDFVPIKGVGNVWKVAVKNSVRMSPDRPDYSDDSWSDLRGERVGRNYEYWIGDSEDLFPIGVGRARPRANDGWVAESLVKRDLESKGYTVTDVSSGGWDCDLLAKLGDKGNFIFVEVKSSVGTCNPTLTEREWLRAEKEADRYWLAIVENMGEMGRDGVPVHYIRNPSSLEHNESNVRSYNINRKSWLGEVEINDRPFECDKGHLMTEVMDVQSVCIDENEALVKVTWDCCGYSRVTSLFSHQLRADGDPAPCIGGRELHEEPNLRNLEGEEAALWVDCSLCGAGQAWWIYPEFMTWTD